MIRKINPKIKPLDTCQRSLDWLENHAKDWFKNNVPNHGKIWFADDNLGLSEKFPQNNELIEIILTGSFFIRMLESKLWAFENFRLWTFSNRVKNILVELFGIPDSSIGIIGRNPIVNRIPRLDFKSPVNFIYAGRLSFSKNITSVLRLSSALQKNGLEVTLDIFGTCDDFPDESLGRYKEFSMQEEINQLVDNLFWKNKPVFHGDVPQGQWLQVKRDHPAFISLSSSMYEDFGTASEMARNEGWATILSDWGGHYECQGARLLPMHYVPLSSEPLFIQELKIKALVDVIISDQGPESSLNTSKGFQPQIQLDRSQFHLCLENFFDRWGPEVLLSLREKMSYFADTTKGMDFFRRYRTLMGATVSKNVLICNDLCINPLYQLPTLTRPCEILYLREIFNPANLKLLRSYEKFTIIGLDNEFPVVHNFLRNIIGLQTPITWMVNDLDDFNHHKLLSKSDILMGAIHEG